jgi:hypothetical protein
LPPGRKPIRCDWKNKANKNEHGAVYHLKSGLMAKVYFQKPGIDYNDAFMPVGDEVILRFVLTFAMHLGCGLFHLDVDTAFSRGF